MGGFSFNPLDPAGLVSDPADQIFGSADAALNEAVKSASNTLMDMAKSWSDNQFSMLNPIGALGATYLGGTVGESFRFERNVVTGFSNDVYTQHHGAWTGDWVEGRDATYSVANAVVAAAAIVIGVFGYIWTGGGSSTLIAAGVIMLDAQYNEGALLSKHIDYTGRVETAVIGTHYIKEYATEIQTLITLAATMYAGSEVFGFAGDYMNIGEITAGWSAELEILQSGYGGYQTYMGVQAILDSQAYWKAKLEEAEAYYRKLLNQIQQANTLWFDMMTNPDFINRIQAGGDLYSMGAGHPLWSPTSVAEPRFALGLIDRGDNEMDRLINGRYFIGYAGDDSFKIK